MKYLIVLALLALTNPCLADDTKAILTVAYECSGCSYAEQVQVAGVIKQRMKERKLTSEQVVLQPSQFSCWDNGKPTQSRKLTENEVETAQKAWYEAVPNGYNHYYAVSMVKAPYWARSWKRRDVIGKHVFLTL